MEGALGQPSSNHMTLHQIGVLEPLRRGMQVGRQTPPHPCPPAGVPDFHDQKLAYLESLMFGPDTFLWLVVWSRKFCVNIFELCSHADDQGALY